MNADNYRGEGRRGARCLRLELKPSTALSDWACVCVCENQTNKVNNFTRLDSSVCLSMVTPPYKWTASSVSITGIFHGSLHVTPPGQHRAGLGGEARRTGVDLGNKPHQSIGTASPPGGHVCVSFVCLFSLSVCVLGVHLADWGLEMGFDNILSDLNPSELLSNSFWFVCLLNKYVLCLFHSLFLQISTT